MKYSKVASWLCLWESKRANVTKQVKIEAMYLSVGCYIIVFCDYIRALCVCRFSVSIPVTGGLKLDQGNTQHMVLTSSNNEMGEEVAKKREVRLYKNRSVQRCQPCAKCRRHALREAKYQSCCVSS